MEFLPPASKTERLRLAGLVLALLTLLVYLPVRYHDFILLDDPDYVAGNKMVQSGLTWTGVKWAFTTWQTTANWHPITWLSHMLDCQLFGLNAGAHHLVNVLFHAANAVLLLALWWRMTGAFWPSVVVASLFAWHPLRVESVAWVSERKDVLSMWFGLLALWFYVRYAESAIRRPQPATRNCWFALLFFALGLMAKPMLVTLPFVFLLLDYWPLKRVSGSETRSLGRLVGEKWPFFLLTAIVCVITFLTQHHAAAVVPVGAVPFDVRLSNGLVSCLRYLLKAFWPADLAVIYPLPPSILLWQTGAAVAVLAAITLLAWRLKQRSPCVLVGWFWFLGTLVPVIGLVQVGAQSMADRYMYLPLVGISIAVVYGIRDLLAQLHFKPAVMFVIVGLVLAGYVVATGRQLKYWQDTESLITRTLAVTKDNFMAHFTLGMMRDQQGHRDQALTEFREALRIHELTMVQTPAVAKDNARAHLLLATAYQKQTNSDMALEQYRAALRLDPANTDAGHGLSNLLVQLGRSGAAGRVPAESVRPSEAVTNKFFEKKIPDAAATARP